MSFGSWNTPKRQAGSSETMDRVSALPDAADQLRDLADNSLFRAGRQRPWQNGIVRRADRFITALFLYARGGRITEDVVAIAGYPERIARDLLSQPDREVDDRFAGKGNDGQILAE